MKDTFKTKIAAAALGSLLAMGVTSPANAFGPEDYIGSVGLFGGNFCPRGTTDADGKLLPINQYQSLYSLYYTTYGGDGRTTFGLPKPTPPGRGMRYCVTLKGIFPQRSESKPRRENYRLRRK